MRPYSAYTADADNLRARDWAKEFERGKEVWRKLIGRTVRMRIPDENVGSGYYACIGDIFIMREPVSGYYIGSCPGTELYRCPNSAEASVAAICLDQVGLYKESELGFRMSLDEQGADGNWNDPRGWGHKWWSGSGFKSWAVMQHYKLTGDRAYLEHVYPRMLASSRWQESSAPAHG